MSEGRDLRNKLAYVNGTIYACGGINCSAEKYNILKNMWTPMKYTNIFNYLFEEIIAILFKIIWTHGVVESHLIPSIKKTKLSSIISKNK